MLASSNRHSFTFTQLQTTTMSAAIHGNGPHAIYSTPVGRNIRRFGNSTHPAFMSVSDVSDLAFPDILVADLVIDPIVRPRERVLGHSQYSSLGGGSNLVRSHQVGASAALSSSRRGGSFPAFKGASASWVIRPTNNLSLLGVSTLLEVFGCPGESSLESLETNCGSGEPIPVLELPKH